MICLDKQMSQLQHRIVLNNILLLASLLIHEGKN